MSVDICRMVVLSKQHRHTTEDNAIFYEHSSFTSLGFALLTCATEPQMGLEPVQPVLKQNSTAQKE